MMNRLCYLIAALVCVAMVSCRDASHGDDAPVGEVTHSRLLVITRGAGYTEVRVKDPWKTGRTLHTYLLVPRDKPLPGKLPEGTVVRTPVSNALVYSSVHTSLMRELGAFEALKGITDAQYFNDEAIARGIDSGNITDCGSSTSPSVEKVIAMRPDAILLSPYQDANYGQVTKLKIPLIECADYMETTPLGRAEWIKFYGELFDRRAQADSIFAAVEKEYSAVSERISKLGGKRPVVLTESVISGVWNVPGGKSYMARLIEDAGGNYPWSDDNSTGSLSLDFNQVLAKAKKADIWLVKSFNIKTYRDLTGSYALNDKFDAFAARHVWVCDTQNSHFFDNFPFHPERLLKEYAKIFHPDDFGEVEMQFFKPMQE